MRKSQLAVETLLIYGVAIMIVMLAIGALIGFGILDLGGFLPDKCDLGDFTCENYLVTPTQVQLELRNNFGRNIQSVNISIVGEGNYEGLWGECQTLYEYLVVQGELTEPPIIMDCNVRVPPGKKIQGTIYANLNYIGTQIPRVLKGSIRTTVSG